MTAIVVPRPAATVLMVRDGKTGLEVFMVVRHHKIDFAAGAMVFPGGSVEPDDWAIASSEATRLGGSLDGGERAMRVAAIRETFEECGVLLARARGAQAWLDAPRAAEITARAGGRHFRDILESESLELALDALIPFAHWITPSIMPKRFDTRFYIVAAPEDQIALHDGAESVDSIWINPVRALAEAKTGRFTLVPVTALNLQLLGESGDVATALASARSRRIVTVEPVAERTASGVRLQIPLEAGYGCEWFTL